VGALILLLQKIFHSRSRVNGGGVRD